MTTLNPLTLVLGLGIITLLTVGSLYYSNKEDGFSKRSLDVIPTNTLWLYYDQSDVNSREWSDFGSRSSHVLHVPFLNLCYESIVSNNSLYNVKVIAGLSDLAILLGGWKELPVPLQNPIAPVGEAEYNWIRSKVLSKFGGLWVSPTTVCIDSFPDYTKFGKVIFFGTDIDEEYVVPSPNTHVMYSPINHPLMIEWEERSRSRIENYEGGKQYRQDHKKDLAEFLVKYKNHIEYYQFLELSRLPSGKRIQIEYLLSSGVELEIPFFSVYVPIYWKELEEREQFGWFLRMSEKQILDSNLTIKYLFKPRILLNNMRITETTL